MKQLEELVPPGTKPSNRQKVDMIFSLLYSGEQTNSRIKRFNIAYRNSDSIGKTIGQTDLLLSRIRADLHLGVAELCSTRHFIHAGAVAWNGSGILIPGSSDVGKSRLVRALVSAGAILYSDEYAVLDRGGRMYSFPRPLQLRDATGEELASIAPESIGGTAAKPVPVRLVLLSAYDENARWSPRSVAPGRAALKLLKNAVSVRRHPEHLLRMVHTITRKAPVFEGVRGEAQQVVDWLRDRQ